MPSSVSRLIRSGADRVCGCHPRIAPISVSAKVNPSPIAAPSTAEAMTVRWNQDAKGERALALSLEPRAFGPCGPRCFVASFTLAAEPRSGGAGPGRMRCSFDGRAELVVDPAARSFVLKNLQVKPRCKGAVGWFVNLVAPLLTKTYSDMTLFQLPPDDERLRILEADGAAYMQDTEKGIDVVLVDAFDEHGFAPPLANRDFLDSIFGKLSGNGVLVINLAGEKESYAGLIGLAMDVFDEQVIVFPVPEDGNHILLAFRAPYFEPRWRWLHNHAKELRAKFGLDFPAFVQKIERAAKLGLARREAIRGR